MGKNKEKGAIVVEATLALTTFIFAIFTILMIVNIYYVQAKMSVALNAAAKEISQYSYLYYKLGVDELESDLAEEASESRATAEETIDGVGTLVESLSDVKIDIETADFDAMMTDIDTAGSTVDSLVEMYGDKIGDDPKEFILGMGKLAGSELSQEAKTALGQILAKSFMKKNLASYKGEDADTFLRRYHVVDGMAGLDFNYTSLMAYGTTDQILLVVTYDVQVIKLLNIDFKFTFRQCAKTTAWDNGISGDQKEVATEPDESIWDKPPTERGKYIDSKETEGYNYVSSGKGFDAYNNAGGANEFINVFSLDTHSPSYSTESGLKSKINSEFTKMYNGANSLGEDISLKNNSGKTVTVHSPKDTRTYKLVIVVPDDADRTLIDSVVKKIKAEKESRGYNLTIEIKGGYGSPGPKKET